MFDFSKGAEPFVALFLLASCLCAADPPVADPSSNVPSAVPSAPMPDQVQQWIKQLGDGSFQVREAAQVALVEAGNPAYFALESLPRSDDAEMRARVTRTLIALELNAIEKLRALGAYFGRRGDFGEKTGATDFNYFSISNAKLRDVELAPLVRLRKLETVKIENSPITNDALVYLQPLKALKNLSLWGTQISDDGLEIIQPITSIEIIQLLETKITSEGIKHLAKMPRLSRIVLTKTKIDGTALAYLKPLEKQIEVLNLGGTRVMDEDLRHLIGFSTLRGLDLKGTSITGAGLVHLRNLPSLIELNLTGSDVKGEELVHQAKLPTLNHLYLQATDVKPENLHVFQATPRLVHIIVPAETFTEGQATSVQALLNVKREGEKLFIHRASSK